MFFKMLKSDLKRKRGLNVILFLFIAVASILVFAGSVQIFSNITSEKTAKKLCRSSDTMFWLLDYKNTDTTYRDMTEEILNSDKNVTDWSTSLMVTIGKMAIDYPDFEETEDDYIISQKVQCIIPLPRKHDLVYDLNDEPFYVPNGCIAIPREMSAHTGVKQGDTVRYTTLTGEVYELEVCCIFKENLSNGLRRFIVSDADYEELTKNVSKKYRSYSICLHDASDDSIDELSNSISKKDIPTMSVAFSDGFSNTSAMIEIISAFILIISVFLIAIIFMTIRFTMIADLKSEEKEIGMMKALGIDSFSFRWLFAAKYITFAIIGGIIGIIAGLPLAAMLVDMFGPDCILPEKYEMLIIGILSVAAIITMMIVFSLFVMRRINKISVIDAIHGENHGERFGKGFPIFLHRRKKMSVPMFSALTDILTRFKRYIFLMIAYSLGAAILLLVFNVRNSVMAPSYARYWGYYSYDFSFKFDDAQREEINKEKEKTGKNYYEVINGKLDAAGIPAHMYFCNNGSCSLELDDNYKYFNLCWQKGETEKFAYRKGGRAPKLANEAAISAFTANKLGIKPGDVVKLSIAENNADHTGIAYNEREVVITALIDYMEISYPIIIMGDEYEGAFKNYANLTGAVIDAPNAKKPAIIKQMKELFGESCVLSGKEAIRRDVGDFDRLFVLLEFGVGGAVLLMLMLITYLYMSIFVTEEIPETALLKSMGFRNISIKAAYMLRISILLFISLVLGEIYIWTLGNILFENFMKRYEVTGMRFSFEFPVSFLLIPLIMLTCLLLTAQLNLRGVKHIGIWKISEE